MKGFVASWFFPPVTTAESIVTYKLLKNSGFSYDVVCAKCNKWSYNKSSVLTSDNINVISVKTEEFSVWIKKAVELFTENHMKNKYDFIMTRSMPPESLYVALEIKKRFPDVKWIASFGDPVALNPYEIQSYLKPLLFTKKLWRFMAHPRIYMVLLALKRYPGMRLLNKLYYLEKKALKKADCYIFPSDFQCRYTLGKDYDKLQEKSLIVPHTYDSNMFDTNMEKPKNATFDIVFSGHTDEYRNPDLFFKALKLIKEINEPMFKKIRVSFYGNMPRASLDIAYAYNVQSAISINAPVDYFESLRIMQKADCLLHIDADMAVLSGGSIFFASKLADYMGAKKPIIGITGDFGFSKELLKNSRNITNNFYSHESLAAKIIELMEKGASTDYKYYENYDVKNVAPMYDAYVRDVLLNGERGAK